MSGPGFLVDVSVSWATSFFARNVSITGLGKVVRLRILDYSSEVMFSLHRSNSLPLHHASAPEADGGAGV